MLSTPIYKFNRVFYNLQERTYIMGVLNLTPDSFSDGGKYFQNSSVDVDKAVEDALKMEAEGADFIDIGGESTRPGSEKLSHDEELERVIPVIYKLKQKIKVPISIDTYKHEVAEECLKEGAEIVNDISGFRFDNKLPAVTSKYDASCILMHIQGTPKDMQKDPQYEDVVQEVYEYLQGSIAIAEGAGINQIITDVGIGFGKTLEHNLTLMKNINVFAKLDYPIVVGVSRKSFISKISPLQVEERLEGTIAANVACVLNGVNIIRVHDVKENKKAIVVADSIKNVK